MWNESFKEVSFIIYCAIFNYSSYYNDVLSITIRKCANRFSMGVCNRIEFVRYAYYGNC